MDGSNQIDRSSSAGVATLKSDRVSGSHAPLGIGVLCLVGCVFLSLFAWKTARSSDQQSLEREFARRADEIAATVHDRMHNYELALWAAVGLWNSSEAVTAQEWRSFTSSLRLGEAYPGVQGVGFITRLSGDQLRAFEQRQRAQGYADYAVFPPGVRSQYGAITYLEPLDERNRKAFGFDLLTEPVRREAMLRARDSSASALSARVVLLQENEKDRQQGALLFLPVYQGAQAPADAAARREAFLGWVYSPFRMTDLMRATLDGNLADVRVQLFDGDSTAPSHGLFDSQTGEPAAGATLEETRRLNIAGRPWTLVITPRDAFLKQQHPWAAFVLLTGLAISAMVFIVVMTLLRSEARARQIARRMSTAFREAEGRHQAIVQAASEAILTIDDSGLVRSFNAGAERIFNFTADEVVGRDIALLISDRDRGATKDFLRRFFEATEFSVSRREAIGRRKGGQEFSAAVSLGLLRVGSERSVVVLLQDVTDRKIAEGALAEADHMQRLLFGSVPYPIISTNNDGIINFVNQAAEAELGYQAAELVGVRAIDTFHLREEIFDRRQGKTRYGLPARPEISALEVLTADCVTRGSSEREWTYLRKGGESFPALVTTSRVTDRSGTQMGFIFLIVDISERKEAECHIMHLAHHDALTDLPNRTLLNERLANAVSRAAANETCVGVLMLDLDHFKRINDTLGHEVGDGLLVAISDRLRSLVRREDTVARMGGDEFVIVLPDVPGPERVQDIAHKIVEGVFRPVEVGGHELQVSGSVGVALYPRDGSDEGMLLRSADSAMYVAKQRGRANYQWYSRSMMKVAEEKMALEADLRRAIESQQLRLGYQPLICLNTGRLLGLESLLRWSHPERGLISPSIFVPMAEEAGLIVRLGEWVLREACRFSRQLAQESGCAIPVSVNVSPRQLAEPDFLRRVREVCDSHGIAAGTLTLEITESIMVDHPEEALKILGALRAQGVSIAIDDFGTGYSSLSYITRFPVDKLKIDRSFIRSLGRGGPDDAISNAIIAMSRALHLEVVAEGVETPAQLQFLIDQGCDAAQGFLFGEFATAAEVLAFDPLKLDSVRDVRFGALKLLAA